MERKIARHDTRASAAHQGAADTSFRAGQRVRTIDGLIGRILEVTESWAPGNTAYQVVLDNGMGGGTYLESQLRPVGEDYGGLHQAPANLPASLGSADGDAPEDAHLASADYPEMGSVLHDHPDPAHQITVIGAKTAVEGHGLDPFGMAMHGLTGDDADFMRATIDHIRRGAPQSEPIDAGDAETMARSMRSRDAMEQAGYQIAAHSKDSRYPRGFGIDLHHNHTLHLVPERHEGEPNWYARISHKQFPMGPKIEHTIRTSDEELPGEVTKFLAHPPVQQEMEHQRAEGRRIHEEIRREGHLQDWDDEYGDPEEHNATWCHVCDMHHETQEEADDHDRSHTDWDRVYPHLGPEIHRGLTVNLPEQVHQFVHDKSQPAADRAHALSEQLNQPVGNSWSTDPGKADHYTVVSGHYGGSGQTHVMMHAATPERHYIETDPDELEARRTIGYDKHEDREVPLRNGTPLNVHGISWRQAEEGSGYTQPLAEWEHHSFSSPRQHVAATYAEDHDARDDEYNGDPELGICRRRPPSSSGWRRRAWSPPRRPGWRTPWSTPARASWAPRPPSRFRYSASGRPAGSASAARSSSPKSPGGPSGAAPSQRAATARTRTRTSCWTRSATCWARTARTARRRTRTWSPSKAPTTSSSSPRTSWPGCTRPAWRTRTGSRST
jgi:hypothetical protein